MSDVRQRDAAEAERLSALLDAEIGSAEAGTACKSWQSDAELRAEWHAWHVIGDVLRSEDLGATAPGDAVFLDRLRTRLAEEPVILAPQPLQAPDEREAAVGELPQVAAAGAPRRWVQWGTPAAVAAGFMLVVGVFVSLPRGLAPAPVVADARPLPSVIDGASAVPALAQGLTAASSAGDQAFVASGSLMRDSQLDGYLAAHQQFSGSTALGEPAGFMRVVTHEASGRR